MDEQVTTPEPVTAENQMEKRRAFGQAIRAARLSAGMSEEAVSQSTRIPKHFISAIEAGEFSKLPGVLFGRGFVQNISRAIGADETSLVASYLEYSRDPGAIPRSNPDVDAKKIETRRAESRKIEPRLTAKPVRSVPLPKPTTSADSDSGASRVKALSRWVIILPATAAAIGLLALFAIGRQDDKSADSSNSPEIVISDLASERISDEDLHEDPPVEAAVAAGVTPVEQEVIAPSPVEQKAVNQVLMESAPQAVAPAQTLAAPVTPVVTPPVTELEVAATSAGATSTEVQELELVVKVPVKIKLTVDGGDSETHDLKADTYRYQFKDRADLMIYDAASVDVAFNGRSLGSLGSKGRIRRLSFAAPQSAQSLAPTSRAPLQ